MARTLPLLLLCACAMTEEDWSTERLRVSCELNYDCTPADEHAYLPWDNLEDCMDPSEDGSITIQCPFDGKVAEDCIAEWEALSCDDFRTGNMPVCNPYDCP